MDPRTPAPSTWFLLPLGSFAAIVAMTGLILAVALPGARAVGHPIAAPTDLGQDAAHLPRSAPALEDPVPEDPLPEDPMPEDGAALPPWHPRLPSRAHPLLEEGAGRCPFAGPGRSGGTCPHAGKRSSCPALRGDGAREGPTLL